jgi:ABC-type branched-subunit amino acid transport system substrate-binding protein
MAISETTLKDVMLMLVEEQNKKGGLLGKKLEAVVVDPASNWPLFAEKARELITQHKVAATFGSWTSVSRKSVLPVVKELNHVFFYPVQYEASWTSAFSFWIPKAAGLLSATTGCTALRPCRSPKASPPFPKADITGVK